MKTLNIALLQIIQILSDCKKLQFDTCPVKIHDFQIETPIGDVIPTLLHQKSRLKNNLVNLTLLKNLITDLDANNAIVRLNHIGFGYLVKSQMVERQRLITLVNKIDKNLYEEESNDFGLWLFLGNTGEWEKPLIEFVPVEDSHANVDQFLPHVQIDIDTTLDANEIESQLKKAGSNSIKSYHVAVINEITHIVRLHLGIIDGVNIFLDLAAKERNVPLHRRTALIKIS